ncbi:MAG: sigma 54-interacting transcriptional regulator, partial [Rhodospirillaceae bacterium]
MALMSNQSNGQSNGQNQGQDNPEAKDASTTDSATDSGSAKARPVRRSGSGMEDTSTLPLVTIYEISKLLSASLNLERSLYNVLSILSSYLQMRRGVVCLNDDHDQLEVVAVSGIGMRDATTGPNRYPLDAVRQVISTAMPMVIHNMAEDPLFQGYASTSECLDGERQSLVCVPIKASGSAFGTLSVERHLDGTTKFMFERDVRYLTMVANLVGQAVALEQRVTADRDRLILEKARLEKALPKPQRAFKGKILDNVIGTSSAMMRVSAQVRQIAPSKATVLLRGESGTGKELIAKAIHFLSPRSDKPFIKV